MELEGSLKDPGQIFTGKAESQPPATFTVFAMEPGTVEKGDEIKTDTPGAYALAYQGDESKADALFGVAMVNNLVEEGFDALVVTNPQDEAVYPDSWVTNGS